MCLGFNPSLSTADMTAAALSALMHENVSCDGSWTGVFRSYISSRVYVLTCIPVTGTSVVVFPILHQHADAISPLTHEVSCFARTIEGVMNPSKYLTRPSEEVPAVRSAGFQAPAMPPPTLDYRTIATRIVCNKFDSGATMLIDISTIDLLGSSRENLALCILNAIKDALDKHDIAHERVFGASDASNDIITSEMTFASMIIEAIFPGLDIIIGIMPEEDKNKASFSFLFDFPTLPSCIPLLGLVHNNHHHEDQQMKESYYLMSNASDIKFVLKSDGVVPDLPIVPQSYKEFAFDSAVTRPTVNGGAGNSLYKPNYLEMQYDFQESMLSDLQKELTITLQTEGVFTYTFGIMDLAGMVIPSGAVSAQVKYNESVFNSVNEMRKRKLICKRALDALKKKQQP